MKKYKFTRTRSAEVRQKISNSLRGRHHSEATKKLLSKKMKEIWQTIGKEEEKSEEIKDEKGNDN